ncbi:GspE/PulE family protein [Blastopirellula sp. JC732]|uniref:GspE/PulE family protein n=1 Tax=Blastopirellula sediminis TaxID=2894196 RepID=A0A9X1MS68_9BACT|nr:GspE/PulE family protein [Blastopirellula sediminis]MCC9605215.1 GspE/PulE family protein [Blastopirellula sediminis]MCC9631485.1 GspE/PulE family protein [Blastopirellula sediminis]
MNDSPIAPDFAKIDLASVEPDVAVKLLIHQAAQMQASDLFVLAGDGSVQVAVRQWGRMKAIRDVPADQGRSWISYLKAMSGMDIAERRRPQDGRWIFDDQGRMLDLRLSLLPTLYGEDLTVRLLDRNSNLLSIEQLGLNRHDRQGIMSMIQANSGLILVTGPTGTGKTTTLYACLQFLNDGKRKINTLEDPVEFSLGGIRQSQIAPKIGLDFSELLRSVIRQQPDVIMIGEIRDAETAATAVRAANSGHLVFATLHAPVAAAAVQSMLSLDVNPHFLASGLRGVLSQRLVRVLDPKTRIPYELGPGGAAATFGDIQEMLDPGDGEVFYGPDPSAPNEGYIGRTAIFELMEVTGETRRAISNRMSAQELESIAIRHGMLDFRRSALMKVAQGVTSMEEVFKNVPTEYLGLEDA